MGKSVFHGFPVFALVAFLLTGFARGENPDILHLLNGDFLQGRVSRLEGSRLVFSPAWGGEIEIPAAYAGRVTRTGFSRGTSDPNFVPNVRVSFLNGDTLDAQWFYSDNDDHHLKTSWGQTLRAKREWVTQKILLPDPEMLILGMPLDLSHWRMNDISGATHTPEVFTNRVHLNGISSIAHTLPPLPERMILEFTMVSPDGRPGFVLDFLSRGPAQHPQTGLAFHFHGDWLTVRSSSPRGRNQQLFRGQLLRGPRSENIRTHVQLLADLSDKTFLLRVNGIDFQEFDFDTDERLVGARGLSLRLSSRTTMTRSVVEDLRLWRIDGPFPVSEPLPEQPDRPVFVLSNGDVLQANFEKMADGNLHLRLPSGHELIMEPSRLSEIRYLSEDGSRPRLNRRDIKVELSGTGDRLTMELSSLNTDKVSGNSELFRETLTLPFPSVGLLIFNPHHAHRRDEAPDQYGDILLQQDDS